MFAGVRAGSGGEIGRDVYTCTYALDTNIHTDIHAWTYKKQVSSVGGRIEKESRENLRIGLPHR